MPSQRKIDANRRNAQLSTGPKTQAGKNASSRNSLKHGLAALELRHAPEKDQRVFELARAVSPGGDGHLSEAAVTVAEASLFLLQIKKVQAIQLARMAEGHATGEVDMLRRVQRYETRAQARRRKAARKLISELDPSSER